MNVRDPKFTARLEEALRLLTRQPTLPLAYLTRRFDLESGALPAWLAEFNGGQKALKADRIEQVKGELGAIKVTRVAPAPAVPVAKHSAPNGAAPAVAAANAAPPPDSPRLAAPGADIGRWLEQQRAKITARVNCFQVEVTPALAGAWLAFNGGNRNPSKAKIRRFATAMRAGRWTLNGETVKFSSTGRLLDGQSRLMAIIQAGVPIVLELRSGLPDIAQQSMDVGELRKGAHVLEMIGEANPIGLAAALKILWVWRNGWLGGRPFGVSHVMENSEVQPLLAEHPGLKASVGWTVSTGAKIAALMPRSEAAFFHYLLGRIDAAKRDTFFEQLTDGLGMTKRSPTYHLRERLLADRSGPDSSARKKLRRGLVARAWNAMRMDTGIDRLTYAQGDPFPDIDGIETPAFVKPPESR